MCWATQILFTEAGFCFLGGKILGRFVEELDLWGPRKWGAGDGCLLCFYVFHLFGGLRLSNFTGPRKLRESPVRILLPLSLSLCISTVKLFSMDCFSWIFSWNVMGLFCWDIMLNSEVWISNARLVSVQIILMRVGLETRKILDKMKPSYCICSISKWRCIFSYPFYNQLGLAQFQLVLSTWQRYS